MDAPKPDTTPHNVMPGFELPILGSKQDSPAPESDTRISLHDHADGACWYITKGLPDIRIYIGLLPAPPIKSQSRVEI
jgi:hypothetical protein